MKNLLFACVAHIFLPMIAQDGSADLSFGDNGIVLTDLGEGIELFRDVGENSQGQLILIGNYDDNGTDRNIMIRYTEDGNLDPTFGTNGIILTDPMDDSLFALLSISSDDKMLVLSSSYQGPYTITGYLEDGTINPDFGDNGIIDLADFGDYVLFRVGQDQSIFVATSRTISDQFYLAVRNYTSEGVLNLSYGNGGEVLFPIPEVTNGSLKDLNVLENNELILLYSVAPFEETSIHLLKLLSNGETDPQYGIDGIALIPLDDVENIYCSCLTFPDKSTLVSCGFYLWQEDVFYQKMRKMDPAGLVDTEFLNSATEDTRAVLIQPNSRFIADISFIEWEGGIYPGFQRHFSNGYIDSSFQLTANYTELGVIDLIPLESGALLLGGSDIWYQADKYFVLQKFINSPLGVEENSLKRIVITPNPSEGIFQLKFENGALLGTPYSLTDISGKLIQTGVIDSLTYALDLSRFEAGMYFLSIDQQTYRLLKN